MLLPGRISYGGAIVGFGVLCLAYADFVHQLQPVPGWLPAYRLFALATGALLVAAGGAILIDRRTAVAATALVAFLSLWVVLLQVPSAFVDPALLRSPWWVRTFETVAIIGGAATLAGLAGGGAADAWLRRGRIAYGLSLPVFGTLHLVYPQSVADLVPPWYPWPMFWAVFTGGAMIAGGLAIASGVLARPAALLAGVMYGTWAWTLHVPRCWCQLFGPCAFLDAPVGFATARGGLTSMFVAFAMSGSAWIVLAGLAPSRAASDP